MECETDNPEELTFSDISLKENTKKLREMDVEGITDMEVMNEDVVPGTPQKYSHDCGLLPPFKCLDKNRLLYLNTDIQVQLDDEEIEMSIPTTDNAHCVIDTKTFYGGNKNWEKPVKSHKAAESLLSDPSQRLKKQTKKMMNKPVVLTFPGFYKRLKLPKKNPKKVSHKLLKNKKIKYSKSSVSYEQKLSTAGNLYVHKRPLITPDDRIEQHVKKLKLAANILKENNKLRMSDTNSPHFTEPVLPSQSEMEIQQLKPVIENILNEVLDNDKNVTSDLIHGKEEPENDPGTIVPSNDLITVSCTTDMNGLCDDNSVMEKIRETPKSTVRSCDRKNSSVSRSQLIVESVKCRKPSAKKVLFPSTTSTKKHSAEELKVFRPSHMANNDQYTLDCGQKDLGITVCKTCSMLFDCVVQEDVATHAKFHNRAVGLKHIGWKRERVVGHYSGGRVIVVTDSDPTPWKLKVNQVINFSEEELGCDPTILGKDTKTYLFVSGQMIVGYLVMEPLSKAYKTVSVKSSDSVTCTTDAFNVVCGVRRVWVASGSRRKRIATKLLNSARLHFKNEPYIQRKEIAICAPTEDGKEFFKYYMGTQDYFVYE